MNVCLISPKWNKMVNSYPSLGLGYLAAYLEREGHRVTIFDLGLEPNTPLAEDIAAIAATKPDLIGLTAMSTNYESALATARALKAQTGAPIVIGGPHATVLPEHVIRENVAAINRGRDYARKLRDDVAEATARGRPIASIVVSPSVAADMRQFFNHAFAEFDGMLPRVIGGAALAEGNTGGDPIVYGYAEREH